MRRAECLVAQADAKDRQRGARAQQWQADACCRTRVSCRTCYAQGARAHRRRQRTQACQAQEISRLRRARRAVRVALRGCVHSLQASARTAIEAALVQHA